MNYLGWIQDKINNSDPDFVQLLYIYCLFKVFLKVYFNVCQTFQNNTDAFWSEKGFNIYENKF